MFSLLRRWCYFSPFGWCACARVVCLAPLKPILGSTVLCCPTDPLIHSIGQRHCIPSSDRCFSKLHFVTLSDCEQAEVRDCCIKSLLVYHKDVQFRCLRLLRKSRRPLCVLAYAYCNTGCFCQTLLASIWYYCRNEGFWNWLTDYIWAQCDLYDLWGRH